MGLGLGGALTHADEVVMMSNMKANEMTPQGTPRTDNSNILEWFGPEGKVLQLVKLASGSSHYRFHYPGGDLFGPCYYSTKRWSLWQMLDLLNQKKG